MRALRWTALAAVLFAGSAQAAGVRLGLGGDYWLSGRDPDGLFQLTLAVDGALTRNIAIGGRFGAMISTLPYIIGAPIDLVIRANVGGGRVYLEGLVGPWFLFTSDAPLRVHGAFGFGLNASSFSFGIEVGWLDPSAIIGLRLGFRI